MKQCTAEQVYSTRPLLEYLKMVPDPRSGRKTKHDLAEVLLCLILGYLAGRTTIRRSLNWCRSYLKELRKDMPLKNGIASPSTACRMLSGIDKWMFQYVFMEWAGEIVPSKDRHIAIDGKALCASADKVKGVKASMLMNAVDVGSGMVLAQMPIREKTNEITAIPELLKLFDIQGSTITTDSIGTQTEIMLQIREQGGHFVLIVKENQSQTYHELLKYMGEAREDYAARKKDGGARVRHPEIMESYDEWRKNEPNHGRNEERWCCITKEVSIITKTQEEWPWLKTAGLLRQVRIPQERDKNGEYTTPDVETFLKEGSRRKPKPQKGDGESSDIQEVGLISDRSLSAQEIAEIKRKHWSVENQLHHVLDDTFREDRSPAKKSRNNLALVRKFAYNILRMAINAKEGRETVPEMMDLFCDNMELVRKYMFQGIVSLY